MIFQWKDASVPVASGLLAFTGSAIAPQSPILWTNRPLINVLYDKVVSLKPRVTSGWDVSLDTKVLQGGMAPVFFASTTTFIQKNGIYALLITDDAITTFPSINLVTELEFTDA
jgi:hypothetical protein